jgi:hypothetical protein
MKIKTCNKCEHTKSLDDFYKVKSNKDGRSGTCKDCKKSYAKSYRELNQEKIKNYREDNREAHLAYKRDYYKKNKDWLDNYYKNYREENRQQRREHSKNYKVKNKSYFTMKQMEREARKKFATPNWLSETHKRHIEAVYEHARECEMLTGDKYHVDHIVPLRGKNISGLHVPWNLQVLPADVNMTKSNKYDPDIQCPTAKRAS